MLEQHYFFHSLYSFTFFHSKIISFILFSARFNYTCAGVRKAGQRRSDVYYIDFDGMGPMTPVKALCDLGRTVETTTTQINNTYYVDMDVTTDSGFNNVDINYMADIVQMRELIMNSASCKQYIKYQCKATPLFRSPTGPPAVSPLRFLSQFQYQLRFSIKHLKSETN